MFSEDELYCAAGELALAMAHSLPAPEECHHDFSPAFARRMARLIRRARHPVLHRAARRVAGLLLAILVGCGVWLTLDAQAREAFFTWVGERVDGVQHYFFDGPDASQTPNVRYRLPEAPEGYWEEDAFETESGIDFTYMDEAGHILSFGAIFRPTGSSVTETSFFDMDKMEKAVVLVNGEPAEWYVDHEGKIGNVLVWQDEETGALLYLSGYFDRDDMIRMAEAVLREEK